MPRVSDQTRPDAWFLENGFVSDDGTGSSSPTTATSGDLSPTGELTGGLAAYGVGHHRELASTEVTISVAVPTSDHVAEIVGKQGSKIKALRERTNTNIKTPQRDEPPVFTIEGRLEDVMAAQLEIQLAAEHFTRIRGYGLPPTSLASLSVTAFIRVPPGLAGLVVGPKGATIKRIQQASGTIIVSPTPDQPPMFEVTGLPQDIEAARYEIEQYLLQRTSIMCAVEVFMPLETYTGVQRAMDSANTAWPSLDSVGANTGPLWSDACDYPSSLTPFSDGWLDFDRKSCASHESAGYENGSAREKSKLSEWLSLKPKLTGESDTGSDDASSSTSRTEAFDRVEKSDGARLLISPIWSNVDTFVTP